MTESLTQRAIVVALRSAGLIAIRIQSGKVRVKGGWMLLAPNGTPDLYVIGWGWLECKTDEGELNADQQRMHERIRKAGERVAVVRSPQEALEAVHG